MALTRGASAALIAALGGHFHPAILTRAEWPDGAEYRHSGFGDMSWDGQTWSGLDPLLIDTLGREELGGDTAPGQIRVAGTLAEVMALRAKAIRNHAIEVWFAAVTTPAGATLAAEPVSLFSGYFDSRTLTISRSDGDMSHDLLLGVAFGPSPRASAAITHGPEDQQAAYPGDTAGRHVIHALKRAVNPPIWPEP